MKSIIAIMLAVLAASSLMAQKLVIKGSDTLGAKMVPQLAEQFRADNPGVAFEIAAEGSSTGIAAILDATADIGMSSRDISEAERSKAQLNGRDLQEIVVGFDGIAIIVNEKNPISNLTLRQVERIFTGKVTDWSAVRGYPGKISVYTRNTASGTYGSFKELAMRKKDYGPETQKMAGNEQIVAEVAKNPYGIGYVGLAYLNTPGIKVITINNAPPTPEAIREEVYPLARPLFYYTGKKPEGLVEQFINFTLSERGQQIVANVHFVPVK